ncbi:MAG: hypothetical protein KatS3mg070_1802 [Meiothermus sp.]|jgi:hypothetical protein|uniref:Uncharacterized protein n=1 Tax=Meiothermus ruber TaxID=277 RepID=A0A7C3HQ88_MEIRU|nr:hypothetical protein [Meiothermus sp.]GIW28439.1 MAG: hypothetical protein KatS3mg070_1802 [Meiothermus sp.]
MLSSPSSSHSEGILILDSRNMPGTTLRYQGSFSVWNRLYKVGHFYLDLSLKGDESGAFLVGQVICETQKPSSWQITLHGPSQHYSSPVSEYGSFRIKVAEKGEYDLELALGHETFWVRGLDIS